MTVMDREIFGFIFALTLLLMKFSPSHGTPKFLSTECSRNCTKNENLPCKVLIDKQECFVESSKDGPKKPDVIVHQSYELVPSTSSCSVTLSLSVTPAMNDSSTKLKGFLVKIVSHSGQTVNDRECGIIDMNQAQWTRSDILKKYVYTFDCFKPLWGKYQLTVCSLPMPENIRDCWQEKLMLNKIMFDYGEGCQENPPQTTKVTDKQSIISSVPVTHNEENTPRTRHLKETGGTKINTNTIAMVFSVAAGVVLLVIIVAILIHKNRKPRELMPPFSKDENPNEPGGTDPLEDSATNNQSSFEGLNNTYNYGDDYQVKNENESGYDSLSADCITVARGSV